MTQLCITPSVTDSAGEKLNTLFGSFNFEDIVDDVTNGKFGNGFPNIFKKIAAVFMGELRTSMALVCALVSVVIISALLNNLIKTFGKSSLTQVSHMACFAYISAIAAGAFSTLGKYASSTLNDISVLVNSLLPCMATLSAAGGSVSQIGISHPVVYFICSASCIFIKGVILPLVMLRAGCGLMAGMCDNNVLMEFCRLFDKLYKTVLAFAMTLFVGMLGVCRFASSSFDSLAAKGIKFAVSSAVPVVGGSVSEAMGSVAASAKLIKNAAGIAGIVVLFAIFTIPLIKIGVMSLIYKFAAVLCSGVEESAVTNGLKIISDCIDMLFASIACSGIIMIIAIASVL